jgi:hypothetical protein
MSSDEPVPDDEPADEQDADTRERPDDPDREGHMTAPEDG